MITALVTTEGRVNENQNHYWLMCARVLDGTKANTVNVSKTEYRDN